MHCKRPTAHASMQRQRIRWQQPHSTSCCATPWPDRTAANARTACCSCAELLAWVMPPAHQTGGVCYDAAAGQAAAKTGAASSAWPAGCCMLPCVSPPMSLNTTVNWTSSCRGSAHSERQSGRQAFVSGQLPSCRKAEAAPKGRRAPRSSAFIPSTCWQAVTYCSVHECSCTSKTSNKQNGWDGRQHSGVRRQRQRRRVPG
jgi:hypothetical protein